MSTLSGDLTERIKRFVIDGIHIEDTARTFASDPFWKALSDVGTEIWLDTGDIDAARELWSAEMSALTTNNTLLNNEIQKGIYDDFIEEADRMLGELDTRSRVLEIAFILNARHGLRLVETFGGKVSVELHTDLSHDLEGIVHYGRRFSGICPSHFIVKVPLTATGLLGARRLREFGVPVNFTLEFSARQNVLVTKVARPNYCNVFLGRLNSFVKEYGLGSGENVGEKTTVASQLAVRRAGRELAEPTRQIAASMRSGEQVQSLAGIDVFTMPPKAAHQAKESLDATFTDRTADEFPVRLDSGVDRSAVRIEKLWEVEDELYALAERLDSDPPASADVLVDRVREAGYGDLFPVLDDADYERIANDGKIPDFGYWREGIRSGQVALDTLMNLAGLASFAQDQKALDNRIRGIISE